MSRSGPAKTPTAILKMRGSRKALDRDKEPQPPSGKPRCPSDLSDDEKKVWKQLAPKLDEMGVLSIIDVNSLARYCEVFVRYKNCQAFVREHGEVYPIKDEHGNTKCLQQWPQVGVINKLTITLLRLEQEFGMTPASRADLKVDAKPQSTIAAKYFNDA